MKGDFARVTYDPARHISQVFQQQGRVLLEADWNEQGALMLHLLRALATDVVGSCWAAGPTAFSIKTTDPTGKPIGNAAQWQLAAGHFYVDGILCENQDPLTLGSQPYAPVPEDHADGTSGFGSPGETVLVWLDVWERHLSWVEAPWTMDPALNGLDTASRAQVVWQLRPWTIPMMNTLLAQVRDALKIQRDAPDTTPDDKANLNKKVTALDKLIGEDLKDIVDALTGNPGNGSTPEIACDQMRALLTLRSNLGCPRLRAQLKPPEESDDPCIISTDARYRGTENQLYRIEVHDAGPPSTDGETRATFKWSRENGSVIFPIEEIGVPGATVNGVAPLTVQLSSLGRDQRLGLEVQDWVELVDDHYTLAQKAGPLLQVTVVDTATRTVTLAVPSGITPYLPRGGAELHPFLRRWDQRDGVNTLGVIPLREGVWFDLEDGIQVRFDLGGVYSTGDYWPIAARAATANILWPEEEGSTPGVPRPAPVKASGLHYAALLGVADGEGIYRECCCRFVPICTQRMLDSLPRNAREDAIRPLFEPAGTRRAVAPKKRRTTPKP
jgi:hypothetical protein